MSSRKEPSTYHTNAGGTIHQETDNPALLALLQEDPPTDPHSSQATAAPNASSNNSTAVHSSPHPHEHAQHDGSQSVKVSSTAQPRTSNTAAPQPDESAPSARLQPQASAASPKSLAPAPRSVSQTTVKEDSSNPYRPGERSANGSLAVTPLSHIVPSDTDSACSELALLAGTSSRKSFVPSAAVSEADFGEEADDEGGDAEDASDDEGDPRTPVATTTDPHERNGLPADQRDAEREPGPPHPPPAPGVSPAAAALPLGGRASLTSLVYPSLLRGPAAPSPDLTHPEHRRFVAPYASRRLKDEPAGRSSAVSLALTDARGAQTALSVPTGTTWSATQAARLRARGADADPAPEAAEPDSGSPTPRNSWDQSTDGSDRSAAETSQPPALTGDTPSGDATTAADDDDSDVTRRSSSPPPIEGGSISGPTPQPSAPSTLRADEPRLAPPGGRDSEPPRDSLDPSPQAWSNPSSARVTPGRQGADSTAGGGSVANSARATPASILKKQRDPPGRAAVEASVDRVYVESPGFTREEEDEYR